MTTTLVKQKIISADSHVTIPDDQFVAHVPSKHQGTIQAFIDEVNSNVDPLMAQVLADRKRHQTWWPAQGRPGDHDQAERLKDMEADGISAEILYSQSTVGIDGSPLYAIKDPDARRAAISAYNDTLADWHDAAPGQLIPVGVVPVYDVDFGVAELERIAKKGFRAATLPSYPGFANLPEYWDARYQPLWEAFIRVGIPVSLHTGSTPGLEGVKQVDPTSAKAIFQSLPPMHMAQLVSGFILSGIVPKNPDLQVVLVESGIGWIAYYLERLDTMFRRHSWAPRGVIQELPSNFWKSNFHATFEDDLVGMRTLDRLGVDNLMWASDYPHPDCTWPESQKIVSNTFDGLPEDDKQKMVWRNATELYHLD